MTALPEDMTQFLETVIAVVVATTDSKLKPEVTRGWGVRVIGEDTVSLSVDRAAAQQTIDNLRPDGQVAIGCIRLDFQARQLKGRCLAITEPDEEDIARIEAHRQLYIETAAEYDMAEDVIRQHWSDDVVTLHCRIDELFDQTPGPEAGRVL